MPTVSKKQSAKPRVMSKVATSIKAKRASLLARRPHRSFQLTRRRDAVRLLEMPGYIRFTVEVSKTLWAHKRTFMLLAVLFIVIFSIVVGVRSQQAYDDLGSSILNAADTVAQDGWSVASQVGVMFVSLFSFSVGTDLSELQQAASGMLILFVWLVTVWLLRNLLAGHGVKLRDGIYNAGAPIAASLVIIGVMALQLIPVALAAAGYAAATSSGLLASGGIPAMLFWIAAGLLGLLSLYWIISSLFALAIVTLPGMYPLRALRTAGDIVVGRRMKILYRWLWMALMVFLGWAVVLIPAIFLDLLLKMWIPAIEWVPIVPFIIVVLVAATTIWTATYVYLFYRKVVDNA